MQDHSYLQLESVMDFRLQLVDRYLHEMSLKRWSSRELYASVRKCKRMIPIIVTNPPRRNIQMTATLRWSGICSCQTLYIGSKRIRPAQNIDRLALSKHIHVMTISPSVITFVANAALKSDIWLTRVGEIVGSHCEEIGMQETKTFSAALFLKIWSSYRVVQTWMRQSMQ